MPCRPVYGKSNTHNEELKIVQEELTKQRKVVFNAEYWNESIDWMGRTCLSLRDRTFTVKCITIMHELVDIHVTNNHEIKEKVIMFLCSLEEHAINDIDVLERVLWTLAIVSDKLEDKCLRFASKIVNILFTMGETIKSRSEILPSLTRLVSKEESQVLLRSLCSLLCKFPDLPGKVLWTMADQLPFRYFDKSDEHLYIFSCNCLLNTSNLKAKIHFLQALKRILTIEGVSMETKCLIKESFGKFSAWFNFEMIRENELDPILYEKYISLLKMELETIKQV